MEHLIGHYPNWKDHQEQGERQHARRIGRRAARDGNALPRAEQRAGQKQKVSHKSANQSTYRIRVIVEDHRGCGSGLAFGK
jgi:hypothetical protein